MFFKSFFFFLKHIHDFKWKEKKNSVTGLILQQSNINWLLTINWEWCSQILNLNFNIRSLLMLTTHHGFYKTDKHGATSTCARCIRPGFHSESWVFCLFTGFSECWKEPCFSLYWVITRIYKCLCCITKVQQTPSVLGRRMTTRIRFLFLKESQTTPDGRPVPSADF